MKIIENNGSYRSLAQIFAPSFLKEVVRDSNYTKLNYRIERHLIGFEMNDYCSVLEFLYKKLEKNYRNEYLYKNALINKKLLGTYSLKTTTILDEFKIGGSIADFVLLNGEVRIFEIKTDLDGFDKLEKQIDDYKKFADRIYIVVSKNNSSKIEKLYRDSNIGIIEFTDKNTLKTIKEAFTDKDYFDHSIIFKALRKNEYLEILVDHYGFIPNVPNTEIFTHSLELIKQIDINTFQFLALQKLKERKLKCPEVLESELIPKELKHLCYTLNFSQKEYDNLFKFLKTTI
jgi:hypothetical protein